MYINLLSNSKIIHKLDLSFCEGRKMMKFNDIFIYNHTRTETNGGQASYSKSNDSEKAN